MSSFFKNVSEKEMLSMLKPCTSRLSVVERIFGTSSDKNLFKFDT